MGLLILPFKRSRSGLQLSTSRKGYGRCTVRPNAMRRKSRALQAVSGACHNQIQREGRAIVLVVDDGKPLVSMTFCIHAACEAAFLA